ncbi:MAG: hypothetical protein OEW39_00205 [Deltaproteobacteria bacterium]|nr:hypothetical protein [Deltaproteobacteria bacterium]
MKTSTRFKSIFHNVFIQTRQALGIFLGVSALVLLAACQDVPQEEPTPVAEEKKPVESTQWENITVTIHSPALKGLYNRSNPDLKYTVVDAEGKSVPDDYLRGNVADVENNEQINVTEITAMTSGKALPEMKDGGHTLEFIVLDKKLNPQVTVNVAFGTDTKYPDVNLTTSSAPICQSGIPLVYSTDEEGEVTVLQDGAVVKTLNGETLPSVSDGSHEVSVTVKDSAGNSTTKVGTFVVDTTPPVVTISSPTDLSTVASTPQLVFVSTESGAVTITVMNGASVISEKTISVEAGKTNTISLGTLNSGSYAINLSAADGCQNSTLSQVAFTLDASAPAVSVEQPFVETNTNQIPLVYTATDTQSPIKTVSATLSTLDNTGTIISTVPIVLPPDQPINNISTTLNVGEGTYLVTITVTDEVGNTSSASWVFTIDLTAPVVSITSPANNSTISTDSPTLSAIISDLHFGQETNSKVAVYVYPGTYQDVTGMTPSATSLEGTLHYANGAPLQEGLNTVVVAATDAFGWTGIAYATFTVNAISPFIEITKPDPAQVNTFSMRTISLHYRTHDTAQVVLSINGVPQGSPRVISPVHAESRTYEETLNFPVDGVYTITVEAQDSAGGFTPVQASVTVVINADLPAVTILSPSKSENDFNGAIPVSFTAYNADEARILVDGVLLETMALTNTAAGDTRSTSVGPFKENRAYKLTVEVKDTSMVTAASSVKFSVDTEGPEVSITSPVQGNSYITRTVALLFEIEDATEIGSMEVSVDGTVLPDAVSGTQLTNLGDGAHTVVVKVWDTLGNLGSAQSSFRVDIPPPPPPPPVPDTTPAGNVSNFNAVAGDEQVTLSWINPPDVDFSRVVIRRAEGSAPVSVVDGVSVGTDILSRMTFMPGQAMSIVDTDESLQNGVTYYYTAFTYDTALNVSAGVWISAKPVSSKPSLPTELSFSASRNWSSKSKKEDDEDHESKNNDEWEYDLPYPARLRIPLASELTYTGETGRFLVTLSFGSTQCYYRGGDWNAKKEEEGMKKKEDYKKSKSKSEKEYSKEKDEIDVLDLTFTENASCVGSSQVVPGDSILVKKDLEAKVIVSGKGQGSVTASGVIQVVEWVLP